MMEGLRWGRPLSPVAGFSPNSCRQSHAHAVYFRVEESIEHLLLILQAHTRIPNFHQDVFSDLLRRTDRELPGR